LEQLDNLAGSENSRNAGATSYNGATNCKWAQKEEERNELINKPLLEMRTGAGRLRNRNRPVYPPTPTASPNGEKPAKQGREDKGGCLKVGRIPTALSQGRREDVSTLDAFAPACLPCIMQGPQTDELSV